MPAWLACLADALTDALSLLGVWCALAQALSRRTAKHTLHTLTHAPRQPQWPWWRNDVWPTACVRCGALLPPWPAAGPPRAARSLGRAPCWPAVRAPRGRLALLPCSLAVGMDACPCTRPGDAVSASERCASLPQGPAETGRERSCHFFETRIVITPSTRHALAPRGRDQTRSMSQGCRDMQGRAAHALRARTRLIPRGRRRSRAPCASSSPA